MYWCWIEMTLRRPSFFLVCLWVAAAGGLVLSGWRQAELRQLPPLLSQTHPAAAFAARLAAISDPAELRRLALARHRSLLASDQTAHRVFATVDALNRSALIQNLALLGLGICVYLFEFRTRDAPK